MDAQAVNGQATETAQATEGASPAAPSAPAADALPMHPVTAALGLANPALLKLLLALEGIAWDGAPAVEPDRAGVEPVPSVELLLGGGTAARARVNPASPIVLEGQGRHVTLRRNGVEVAARLTPRPRFATQRNDRGIALGQIVTVHGRWATVALGGGCGLGSPGHACAFCLGRELTQKAGEVWPVNEVVEALGAALRETHAEFVRLMLGYFPGDDSGVHLLPPYLNAIHRHFNTMVAVTMHPPTLTRAIDATYASGVDIVSYNLEAADEAALRHYFPGRARYFGRERYLAALSHAARIFPNGAVWSELLIDLAAPAAVRAAIEEVAALGAVPLLAVSAAGPARTVEFSEVTEIVPFLFQAVFKACLRMIWARDLPAALTPRDARQCVTDAPALPGLIHHLTRNPLGAAATRTLARLRRRLRVRHGRSAVALGAAHL